MSSKSIVAYGRWRAGLVVLGLALLLTGAYGLYGGEDAKSPDTAAAAGAPDRVTRDLATGALAAFLVHSERKPAPDISFQDSEGTHLSLSRWQGSIVLVNLWATWCGPCRKEMPELAKLQQRLGSEDFEVVAISIDRQGAEVARPFLEAAGAAALKLYLDPTTKVLADFKSIGLPASMLIDRSGREIGRLFGPAEWASPEAVRLIETAIAESGTS